MQLVHLSLTNFRNFIRLEMEFPPGPTLVVGPNAQGKPSLLEAIDYLVDAQSPRAGSDGELINFLVARPPRAFPPAAGRGGRTAAPPRRDEALPRGGDHPRLAFLPSRLGRSFEGQLRLPLESAVDW